MQNAVEQRKALGDFVDKDNEDGLGIGRSASGQECHLQPRVPCEQQQIARHLYHTSLHAMPGKLKSRALTTLTCSFRSGQLSLSDHSNHFVCRAEDATIDNPDDSPRPKDRTKMGQPNSSESDSHGLDGLDTMSCKAGRVLFWCIFCPMFQ